MRFIPIASLSLALAHTASFQALARSITVPKNPAIDSRQLLSASRSYAGTDTCLYANYTSLTGLDLPDTLLDDASSSANLDLDSCVCLNQVPKLLRSGSRLAFLVNALGYDAAEDKLKALVSVPRARSCAYSQSHRMYTP